MHSSTVQAYMKTKDDVGKKMSSDKILAATQNIVCETDPKSNGGLHAGAADASNDSDVD